MKYQILYLSFFVVVFTSCHKHNNQKKASLATLRFNVSNLNATKVNSSREENIISLSEFADSINYIKLQAGMDFLIKRISWIEQYNNMFYILDKDLNQIFVFDKDGKFKFIVGAKGKGPKEIIELSDYTIDKKNNRIYIWDNGLRKILIINAGNGEYIDHFKMDGICKSLLSVGTDTFLVYSGHRPNKGINNSLEHDIFTITRNYQIVNKFLPIKKSEAYLANWHVKFSSFTNLNLIVPTYSNTVYQIEKDVCTPRYYLDFGQYNIPQDIYQKYNKEPEIDKVRLKSFRKLGKEVQNKYVWHISNFFETDRLIGFMFTLDHQLYVTFYDKETQLPIIRRNFAIDTKNDFFPIYPYFYKVDRNCLAFYIPSDCILNYKGRISSNSKYKKLFEESSEMDNPTLFLVYLKK